MLEITDLHHDVPMINLSNLNNVVFRQKSGTHIVSFHMRDHHAVPITVDHATAERIKTELKVMK